MATKVKKRTLSIFLNNHKHDDINLIFKFMGNISKNVYNSTIYINSIYVRYKENIYTNILSMINGNKMKTRTEFYEKIQEQIKYFYDLHSKKDSVINTNSAFLYQQIKKELDGKLLVNNNFYEIKNKIINENKKKVTYANKYEYEFIIDNILKSFYLKNYNKTVYQMKNKIPTTIDDRQFINQVKNKKNLFPKIKSAKEKITKFRKKGKLLSDQNIATRFIYRNLGDNFDKLPSDVIGNIIKKAFDNFSSFYALKAKGLKANMTKYLKNGELFIIPFFARSFKLCSDSVRLTVGEYVAKNYINITNNKDLICLNNDEDTYYKKYCPKNNLAHNIDDKKIPKTKNFIVKHNNKIKYIDKNDDCITNCYYIYVKIPKKIIDEKIKLIEVNPLYSGYCFKINFTYDIQKSEDEAKVDTKVEEDKKPTKVNIKKVEEDKKPTKVNSKKMEEDKKPTKVNTKKVEDDESNKIVENNIKNEPVNYSLFDPNKCLSFDFGMKNLIVIYDPSGNQIIIKGSYLISLNNHYNHKFDELKSKMSKMEDKKKKEELQNIYYNLLIRRANKINEFFNKVVKYLYNEYNDKKELIIIGYNINWKTGVNMGKKNNRAFYNIPYKRLIKKLIDKFGEKIIETEESYTSKTDALSLEEIGKKKKYKGNRKHRGLFVSEKGLINADLNGAINIMRKIIPLKEITGKNLFNPQVVNILTPKITKIKELSKTKIVNLFTNKYIP